uniref:Coat protein n=1 Tax=Heterorhabditis bacteriophora TaxID=37862 RepID=A0A1I7WV94_HETBA
MARPRKRPINRPPQRATVGPNSFVVAASDAMGQQLSARRRRAGSGVAAVPELEPQQQLLLLLLGGQSIRNDGIQAMIGPAATHNSFASGYISRPIRLTFSISFYM